MISLSPSIHKPFLGSAEQDIIDNDITTYFLHGNAQTNLAKLTTNEASHIQDVRTLLCAAAILLIISLIAMILLCRVIPRKQLATIILSPFLAISISLFPLLATLKNFDKAFILFHKLLFPQGNYSFPYSSQLIRTYPEQFFATMVIFIGVFFILFAVIILIMWILTKKKKCT